jgi:hypothetical protein
MAGLQACREPDALAGSDQFDPPRCGYPFPRGAGQDGHPRILGAAGAAIGGSIGGTILGVGAATIGGFVGSTIGSVVDSWIVSSLAPTQRIEGAAARQPSGSPSSTEGAVIPRLYGRMRMGGNIIWATDFREETRTTTQGGGKGGGGGGKVKTTEYLYYASFAVALCEGSEAGPGGTSLSGGETGGGGGPEGITGIGRIWADGKLLDTLRHYMALVSRR